MKLTQPHAKILDIITREEGIKLLQKCELYGRVSHRSEELQDNNSWERFITSVVLIRGDFSIIEHEKITVEALVDRGITHEIVRHRIGSYTQESTRFVNYNKKQEPLFICPFDVESNTAEWSSAIQVCENSYKTLISYGVPPQLARSVFPNALASKIIITYNLRTWRHFFLMRTSKEAHPQMRQITIPLLKRFQELIPLLYDDIIPEDSQANNMKRMR